jgi:nicotinamide mononucleotide transporter
VDAQYLRDAVSTIAPAEWIAVALALAYLVLAVRQHIACWVFAATSSAVFLWIFARAGLDMQAALQVFYIAMAAYGWHSWRGGAAPAQTARPVTSWPALRHLAAIVAIVLISVANGALASREGFAIVPYLDALTAWGSVFATWLVARKVLENWLYWIALDLTAAGLYWSQGLFATALLFVLYSGIAVQGYRSWRASRPSAPAHIAAA